MIENINNFISDLIPNAVGLTCAGMIITHGINRFIDHYKHKEQKLISHIQNDTQLKGLLIQQALESPSEPELKEHNSFPDDRDYLTPDEYEYAYNKNKIVH